MELDKSALSLSAARGVRLVALALLEDTAKARARLSRDPRAKTLRRFRVALRRLRSWLRAFEGALDDTVPAKVHDQLRDIAHATNPGRDVDVQLAWLKEASRGWRGGRRDAANWFARFLTNQGAAGDSLDSAPASKFEKIERSLSGKLAVPRKVRASKKRKQTLAGAIAGEIVPHLEAVGARLDEVTALGNEKEVHRARVASKRLRYLVEPAAPHVKRGDKVVARLKSLQDDLGALHDAIVLANELRRAWDSSPLAETPRRFAAVAERAHEDLERAHNRVVKRWQRGGYRSLDRDVRTLVRRLAR